MWILSLKTSLDFSCSSSLPFVFWINGEFSFYIYIFCCFFICLFITLVLFYNDMLIEENKGAYHESMTSPKPRKNWSIMHWIWTLCREFSLIKYPAAIFVASKNTLLCRLYTLLCEMKIQQWLFYFCQNKNNKIFPHNFLFFLG